MFGSDKTIFSFTGPLGVRVDVGQSIIMLGILFLMLGRGDIVFSLTVFVSLILSIYLHEMGHAWACIRQGITVNRVFIFGGGGWCEHAHADPYKTEFIVAMGPIVNLGIWAAGSLLLGQIDIGAYAGMVSYFLTINLFLGIFNLLPMQPLDGGKLTQLLFMRFTDRRTAIKIAGGIGLVFCVLWIPFLMFSFVYLGFILFFFPNFRFHLDMLRS
ncbi:MAG: site-2 protease family protein [Planktomarina sp.]